MNPVCEKVRAALAEQGMGAAAAHLRDCVDCRAFLEALQEIDAALGELPVHDAPPQLVERLMATPRERLGRERPPAAIVGPAVPAGTRGHADSKPDLAARRAERISCS